MTIVIAYRVYNKTEPNEDTHQKRKRPMDYESVWEPNHPSTSLEIKHIAPSTYKRIDTIEEHLLPKSFENKQTHINSDAKGGNNEILGDVKEDSKANEKDMYADPKGNENNVDGRFGLFD